MAIFCEHDGGCVDPQGHPMRCSALLARGKRLFFMVCGSPNGAIMAVCLRTGGGLWAHSDLVDCKAHGWGTL